MRVIERAEEEQDIIESVEEGGSHIHITGEPGAGKSTLLGRIENILDEKYATESIKIRKHNISRLADELTHIIRDESNISNTLKLDITGFSLPVIGGGIQWKKNNNTALTELKKVCENYSGNEFVIFIDDIEKLGESQGDIEDSLLHVRSHLSPEITLITAGQILLNDVDRQMVLSGFTESQSSEFLQERLPDLSTDERKNIHKALDGHPLYLEMLSEVENPKETIGASNNKIREAIEEHYFDSLTEKQEEFLIYTSPLVELNEGICNYVFQDYSPARIRRLLDELQEKVVVQKVDTEDRGGIYEVRDTLRDVLYDRCQNRKDIHKKAFEYYLEYILEILGRDVEDKQAKMFMYSWLSEYHLVSVYGGTPTPEEVHDEIKKRFDEPHRYKLIGSYIPYFIYEHEDWLKVIVLESEEFQEWKEENTEDPGTEALLSYVTGVQYNILGEYLEEEEFARKAIESVDDAIETIKQEEDKIIENTDYLGVERDMHLLMCHFTKSQSYIRLEENEKLQEEKEDVYSIFDKYGFNQDALRGFLRVTRNFLDQLEIEEERTNVDDEMEISPQERTLSQIHEKLGEVQKSVFAGFAGELFQEKNGFSEYVHDAGSELEKMENPLLAGVWYYLHTILMEYSNSFNHEDISAVERKANKYMNKRREYEEEADDIVLNVKDLGDNLNIEVLNEFMEDLRLY